MDLNISSPLTGPRFFHDAAVNASLPSLEAPSGQPGPSSAHFSDLMRNIAEACVPVLSKGTVSASLFSTLNEASGIKFAIGGEGIFKMIAEAILDANEEVLIQTFVWDSKIPALGWINEALRSVADRKEQQKQAGLPVKPLRVHLLIDERGDFADLVFSNGNIFRAGKKWPCTSESLGLFAKPGIIDVYPATFHHNTLKGNHAKTVVVDSRAMIITGANFQQSNFGHQPAHDAALLIRGPAALAAREDFAGMWNMPNRKEEKASFDIQQAVGIPQPLSKGSSRLVPVLFASRLPQMAPSINPCGNPIACSFLSAIQNAKRIIKTSTPNLNAPAILNALADFVNERGGKVELLLGKGFNDSRESKWGIGGTNQYAVNVLCSRVLPERRSDLKIRWFSLDGKTPLTGNVAGASHLKFMGVDSQVIIFGNANLDRVSLETLHEDNVVIDDPTFAKDFTDAVFEPVFQRAVPAGAADSFAEAFRDFAGINGFFARLGNPQKVRIEEVFEEGNGYRTFRLERPEGWNFIPGQYLEAGSGKMLSEAAKGNALLAIASGTRDKFIEITARASMLPWHPNHVLMRSEGERLAITGPIGSSLPIETLPPRSNVLLIGGGSGLTAIRSVMRSLPNDMAVSLFYSTKTLQGIFYRPEVETWMKNGHVISLTQEKVHGFSSGRLTELLREKEISPNTTVFLCGPTELIFAMLELLVNKGLPRTQIYASLPFSALQGGPVYRADHPKLCRPGF